MWTKVCGLTSIENSRQVAEAGVDAIGLNFYSKSKRFVSPELAKEIVKALPENVQAVGLFVNHTADEVREIVEYTGVQILQFHGDEAPQFVSQFASYRILKAFRVDEQNIHQLGSEIESYITAGVKLAGCLIDAKVSGTYGGSGQTAPWELLKENYHFDRYPPMILAGGLNLDNVREAIEVVKPWGVDTASGVESAPGIKDPELTRLYVQRANDS